MEKHEIEYVDQSKLFTILESSECQNSDSGIKTINF